MIKRILLDIDTHQNDYIDFINQPEIENKLNELHEKDEEYVIGLDIAAKNAKDYSCMVYYKIGKDGMLVFDRVIPIENK